MAVQRIQWKKIKKDLMRNGFYLASYRKRKNCLRLKYILTNGSTESYDAFRAEASVIRLLTRERLPADIGEVFIQVDCTDLLTL